MKNLFKLVPVALGLIAMASCSNDDIFEGKTAVQQNIAGDAVNVTVEDLYPATRSAHTASKALKWTANDEFRVYNADLSKFNTWKYDGTSKFVKKNASAADVTPAYAVFPANEVSWTSYDEVSGKVKVVMTLPDQITYDGNSEIDFNGTIAYLSNLPMQGVAQTDETYGVKMPKMQYMTGIVAITLDNVQTKATWLKVTADKNIAGSFVATLEADTKLVEAAAEDVIKTPTNILYVNVKNAPKSRAILYLPIIAQTYNTLTVEYTTEDVATPAEVGAWEANKIKDFAPGAETVTVPRGGSVTGSVLEANYDFQLDTHTPEALTTVFSDRRDVTGTLNLNIDYLEYSVAAAASADAKWKTIKVANMAADVVHVKMPNGIKNTPTIQDKLVIADADATKPFAGKIIFDLTSEATGILDGTNKQDIEINLANAEVELVGDWSNAKSITVTKARKVVFGDGTTVTNIASPLTLTAITQSLTVDENATVATAIKTPSTSVAKAIDFIVKGTVSSYSYAYYAPVQILTTGRFLSGLSALANVTINKSAEGLAVNILQLDGEDQILDLKCGTINTLKTELAADSKKTFTLKNTETGPTAIKTVDASITTLKSGQAAPASYKMKMAVEKAKWFGTKLDDAAAVTGNIYTASQLASITGANDNYKLWNSVDLNNNSWVGVDLQKTFDGQGFTIEKLALTELAANAAATYAGVANTGVGLFASTSTAGATSIKDFTLDGVTFDQPANVTTGTAQKYYKYANIGAVVGKAGSGAALTIEKVIVKNATFSATNHTDINAVGGLVGAAAGDNITFKDNNVAVNITGYYALGGLLGSLDVAKKVTVNNNTVAPTFTVNKTMAANKKSDVNYGKVGDFVGTISIAAGEVDVTNAGTVTSGVANHKEALHFREHKWYWDTTGDNTAIEEQYYFGCQANNNWVGFSISGAVLTGKTNILPAVATTTACVGTQANPWNYFVLDATTVNARYKK